MNLYPAAADVIGPMEYAARQVRDNLWVVALVAVVIVLTVVLLRRKRRK